MKKYIFFKSCPGNQVRLPWRQQIIEPVANKYLINRSSKLHETFSIYSHDNDLLFEPREFLEKYSVAIETIKKNFSTYWQFIASTTGEIQIPPQKKFGSNYK